MQPQPTTSPANATLRHFMDSNAVILWAVCIVVLFSVLALPAFL